MSLIEQSALIIISTAHLSWETVQALEEDPSITQSEVQILIHVESDTRNQESLNDVLDFVETNFPWIDYVLFDRDADILEGLFVHEW
jgi:hypothetical protein